MSEEDVQLLGDSGVCYMGFGTESTSQAVLKLMNKRHQRVDEMYETARKAKLAGIRVNFNLILGYPGETEADRFSPSDHERYCAPVQNVSFSPNIFTPYPGIPIWPQLRELGVAEPQSLRIGCRCHWVPTCFPGLKGGSSPGCERMLDYFLLLQSDMPPARKHIRAASRSLRSCSEHRFVGGWTPTLRFPGSSGLRASGAACERRSLVTGQALPERTQRICLLNYVAWR